MTIYNTAKVFYFHIGPSFYENFLNFCIPDTGNDSEAINFHVDVGTRPEILNE